MLNFWKVGVAPTTPLYTKTPPLAITRPNSTFEIPTIYIWYISHHE